MNLIVFFQPLLEITQDICLYNTIKQHIAQILPFQIFIIKQYYEQWVVMT